MSRRKWGYVIAVVILSAIFSTPHIYLPIQWTIGYVTKNIRPIPRLPGSGPAIFQVMYDQLALWRNQVVQLKPAVDEKGGAKACRIGLIDPESGTESLLDLPMIPVNLWSTTSICGDRIWVGDRNGVWEVVNGRAEKSAFTPPPFTWTRTELFFWNGEPAYIAASPNRNALVAESATLMTFRSDAWQPIGKINIPTTIHDATFGDIAINLGPRSHYQVFPSPDGVHFFVHADELMFHHKGLEIVAGNSRETEDEAAQAAQTQTSNSDATAVASSDQEWTLVRLEPADVYNGRVSTCGLMVDGQPVALIIDGVGRGNPVGQLYRLEGEQWIQFAAKSLPFASTLIATAVTDDHQRSYLGIVSPLGDAWFYAIDANGFRETPGSAAQKTSMQSLPNVDYKFYLFFPLQQWGGLTLFAFILGVLLSLSVWPLMWMFTKPVYEFGFEQVRLASLGWRGIGGVIDLSLISLSVTNIGWMLFRGFDWPALADALNLHASHPTVTIAALNIKILAVCLIAVVLLFVWMQSAWGFTPGKWACRLRTIRTSLRPCGFARSLVREIVFFVDCGNFFCWTPGILMIALTDRRQRLGDLVGDTIVVVASSTCRTDVSR